MLAVAMLLPVITASARLTHLCSSGSTAIGIDSNGMVLIVRMTEMRYAYKIVLRKSEGKKPLDRPKLRGEDIVKVTVQVKQNMD